MKNVLTQLLENSKKIAIVSHTNPDADALCSSLAFKNIIKNNYDYKYVDVFVDGEIGSFYEPILRDEIINPMPYYNYDLAIVLDCSSLARTGKYAELLSNIPTIINIDHHETNDKFGTINYVSSQSSSTCEILYLVAKGNNLELNNLIAKELYQGIITDTNCFTSLSISKRTHQVVSELMNFKFDCDAIKEYYFKNNSKAKTKLLSRALLSMKFYKGEKFTTMKISNETFTKVGASFEDTLGLIDNGINISGTEVSAILIESEANNIHVSLRSKGNVNVGEIAQKFGGGGNQKLAAFQFNGELKEIEGNLVASVLPLLSDETESEEIIF